jgi:hypothetical protein
MAMLYEKALDSAKKSQAGWCICKTLHIHIVDRLSDISILSRQSGDVPQGVVHFGGRSSDTTHQVRKNLSCLFPTDC